MPAVAEVEKMRKLRLIAMILASMLTVPSLALPRQNPVKAPPPSKKPELTAEEKEILKHREILEKLELLQNFEKIQYLEFLADKKPNQNSNSTPAKSAGKDNASKTPSK